MSRCFTVTCAKLKQQYAHLSTLLQASSGAKISPGELRITTPSFSPTPTLTHRIMKTPPPSCPPRPSSAQSHRSTAVACKHYQPVFVKPTTFSLEDREKEDGGVGGATSDREKGLNLQNEWVKRHDRSDGSDSDNLPKAPVSFKTTVGEKPKSAKTNQNQPKATTSQPKSGKMSSRDLQIEIRPDQNDPTPEILSLEGSPVVPGRRMFKFSSQESLDRLGDSVSPDMGRAFDGRGSPILTSNRGGSPDLSMGQVSSGNRVKVLPTPKTPQTEGKLTPLSPTQTEGRLTPRSPAPAVKPKPNIPKKPQFLKQNSPSGEEAANSEQPSLKGRPNEKDAEKNKPKKSHRFPKLPGFGGGGVGSPKRTARREGELGNKKETKAGGGGGGGGGKEVAEVGEVPSGRQLGGEEGDGLEDGRKSPILQGRRGTVYNV